MRKKSIGNQASLLPPLMIRAQRLGGKRKTLVLEVMELPTHTLKFIAQSNWIAALLNCKLTPARGFGKFGRDRERLCSRHHLCRPTNPRVPFPYPSDTRDALSLAACSSASWENIVSGWIKCFVPISIFIALIKRWNTFQNKIIS